MENLRKLQKEVDIEGSMAIIETIQEELEEERRKAIIFQTINKKMHRIERMSENQIEEALRPVWSKVDFVKCRKVYRSVKVIMKTAEVAKKN